MDFFYLFYALAPAFLSIFIALYLLFTGFGEAHQLLEGTSPYLWASTGIGLCIGFSILGAWRYIFATGPSNLGDVDYSTGVLNSMCSSFFPDIRRELGPYLVDKTRLIENIVVDGRLNGRADLVLRPRRCGKSTMLQMLKSLFSIPRNGDPGPRVLFDGLEIAMLRQDICAAHMGKYPVICCDFISLTGDSWDEMLRAFKMLVRRLYQEWEDCLMQSLHPNEKKYFESIRNEEATGVRLAASLCELTGFLARKFGRRVIVLIDEYDAPVIYAYKRGYSDEANSFFGRSVLPALLKANRNLQYAVLVGIKPAVKSGWYSALNNLEVHALHTYPSVFAGMVMFTEPEVE